MTLEKLLIYIRDELLIERPCSQHQPIVKRPVKKIDGRVQVEIFPNRTLRDRLQDRLSNPFTPRNKPTFAKRDSKIRIGLHLRHQRSDEVSPLTAEEGHLQI